MVNLKIVFIFLFSLAVARADTGPLKVVEFSRSEIATMVEQMKSLNQISSIEAYLVQQELQSMSDEEWEIIKQSALVDLNEKEQKENDGVIFHPELNLADQNGTNIEKFLEISNEIEEILYND